MALDGTMCPSQKLVDFVLFEQKTNVNNEHHLIPGIGTCHLGNDGASLPQFLKSSAALA
jgi:hypothetical protein